MKPGFLELSNRKIVLPLIKKVPDDDQTTLTSSPFILDGSPLHTDLFPLRTSYQFNTPNLQLKYLRFPWTNSHDLNCVGIPSKRPFERRMIRIQTRRVCRVTMCKQITGKCRILPSRIGMESKCISLELYEWVLFDGIIVSRFGMDLEIGIMDVNRWVLPKDRILWSKKHWAKKALGHEWKLWYDCGYQNWAIEAGWVLNGYPAYNGSTCQNQAITHIHLTTDHDLTQPVHCHTWQCGTFSNLAISNINRHQWTGRDSMLTAHAPFIHWFSIVYLDSFNPFHVHTYISCWGPEELSPSLEINSNSELLCANILPLWPVSVLIQQRRWKLVSQCSHWAHSLHPTLVLWCTLTWPLPERTHCVSSYTLPLCRS